MAGDPLVDGSAPQCAFCQEPLGGFAVEIRDGVIIGARYFRQGEFDPFHYDHYTFEAAGRLVPHEDLLHHPFAEVRGD